MAKTQHTFPFLAHARASGVTIHQFTEMGHPRAGRVLLAGEEFEVTEAFYEHTLDALGRSWLDLTEAEQVAKYGSVRWAKGPRPEGMQVGFDDEGHLYKEGQKSREYAKQISDPRERAEALAAVEKKYGKALHPVAQTSQYIPPTKG